NRDGSGLISFLGGKAGLTQGSNGILYGATSVFGNAGGVFSCDTNYNFIADLHDFGFTNNDGGYPDSAVALGTDGYLYGSTSSGGTHGDGVIYRVQTNGNNYQVLHNKGSDGSDNAGGTEGQLLEASDGALYGTTPNGGSNYDGIIFTMQRDGT